MAPLEHAVLLYEYEARFVVHMVTGKTLARGKPSEPGYLLWRIARTEGTQILSQTLLLPAADKLAPGSPAYLRIVEAIEAVWGIRIYLVHKYEIAEIRSSAFRKALAPFKELLAEVAYERGEL